MAAQAQGLTVAPHWRRIDCISDLHLHGADSATFAAWQHYMENGSADAVFILGDLFEVWVGDDAAFETGATDSQGSFEMRVADVLACAARRCPVYFMAGNRDFLVGSRLLDHCGVQLLGDPCILQFPAERWLLSHGDALCLEDTEYLQFRAMVRAAVWQASFLSRPLADRRAMARAMRARSESRKASTSRWFDVDANAARQWLHDAIATTLLHGHTHRPALHDLGDGLQRIVLSDWDLTATPGRAQVLRLTVGEGGTVQPQRLAPAQA